MRWLLVKTPSAAKKHNTLEGNILYYLLNTVMTLITGASGFLGRHLVRYLSGQGAEVRALYNKHAPGAELRSLPGITWMRCDLLDVFEMEEAMRDIMDVYHCAAIVTFNAKRHEEMLHFNTESTANIVNQALEQGIRKLVYVSSVAALGRGGKKNKELTEEEEWSDSSYNSAYGLSKYLAEMEVWRGIGEGLNAVIVNPGIILGPCEQHDPPYPLLKAAYKEFPFYTKGITSWVDVADVVKSLVMLMDSDISEERFIVSGGNLGFREVFTLLAAALGKRPPRYAAGSFMTGLAWRWGRLMNMLGGPQSVITKETAANANLFCYYNNEKLPRALAGFSYTPVSKSIEGMARSFINSYKK
jgi:dihydroflavonol-4-reductase